MKNNRLEVMCILQAICNWNESTRKEYMVPKCNVWRHCEGEWCLWGCTRIVTSYLLREKQRDTRRLRSCENMTKILVMWWLKPFLVTKVVTDDCILTDSQIWSHGPSHISIVLLVVMSHHSRTVGAQLLSVEFWYNKGVVTEIALLTNSSCMDKGNSLPI